MKNETRNRPKMAESTTTIKEEDLNVHDRGRITIPADVRDEFMLRGRLAEVHLLDDEEEEYAQFNRKVGSEGRVTIPKRIRDKHGIEDDDDVDIELHI